jgi:tRNA (mo5U34)-methyltransferase
MEHGQSNAESRAANMTAGQAAARMEAAQGDYAQQVATFQDGIQRMGVAGLQNYYWYHTVDLGNGLVTPGDYDFRDQIGSFGLPDDLRGKRVLDIGSATGYFAFEFEKRGAEVVSVELPSLAEWDIISGEHGQIVNQLMQWHNASTPEEAYVRHLDGPFRFCHKMLGSKVTRCYSSVYDLTLHKVGGKKFDVIYAGDILLHLFSPLKALDTLSTLCAGQIFVTIDALFQHADQPYMRFVGMESRDGRSWWLMSKPCLENMLKRVGFRTVTQVGAYSGILRRVSVTYQREVLMASK